MRLLLVLASFGFASSYCLGAWRRPAIIVRPLQASQLEESGPVADPPSGAVRKAPIGSTPEFAIAGDNTEETPYQRGVVSVHFLATLVNLVAAGSHLPVLATPKDWLPLVLTIIASIVLGDMGTGIFHWSVDNYGGIKTPIFGSVCVAFQGHHDTPWTITFRSFCNNVFKIAYGTIPALVLVAVLVPAEAVLAKVFLTLFINWWLISQEFHKWAHMRTVPPVVKFLQDSGIILSRKEHGLHHTSPFEEKYCILTGICNPILDSSRFFRVLEKVIWALTGNEPNTWKADPSLRL